MFLGRVNTHQPSDVVSGSLKFYPPSCTLGLIVFAPVHTYPIPNYRLLYFVGAQKVVLLEKFSCHVCLTSFLTEVKSVLTVVTWMTESPHRDVTAALLRPQFRGEKGFCITIKPTGGTWGFFFLFLTWLQDTQPRMDRTAQHRKSF